MQTYMYIHTLYIHHVEECMEEERDGEQCEDAVTLRISMSLLMTSLTRLGRSSAHWQYSITIFTSRGTILEERKRLLHTHTVMHNSLSTGGMEDNIATSEGGHNIKSLVVLSLTLRQRNCDCEPLGTC